MNAYYSEDDCRLDAFTALCERKLDPATVPHAVQIVREIPIYDVPALADALEDPARRRALMAEWSRVFGETAGVLVLRGATDISAVEAATAIYHDIIEAERASGDGGGDHFAGAGANSRVWNSLQKLCLHDPEVFARYFAAPALDAVAEAWLGPGYQMTAQVNLVRPGGRAQVAHRDYHLGFMDPADVARFPVHAHHVSPALTLQGAIAHGDMPVESGPTKLLPFSQGYGPGYIACQLPPFRDVFEARSVQLPLAKGDALFFSPALFHGAGDNRTADIQRMANLLQISSAMGRPTEALDRAAMARALYPVLADLDFTAAGRAAAIAAAAEGYAYPTNLDTDPPVGGLAPEALTAIMTRMLDAGATAAEFGAALDAWAARRAP